jgi:hypothetical protein
VRIGRRLRGRHRSRREMARYNRFTTKKFRIAFAGATYVKRHEEHGLHERIQPAPAIFVYGSGRYVVLTPVPPHRD